MRIEAGQVAGLPLDVFVSEPPSNQRLIALPQVIVTPHLGASTAEAQINVAIDVAKEMAKVLKGEPFKNAVNLPTLRPEVMRGAQSLLLLAERLGRFIAQILEGQLKKVRD